jgi:hypothetical protein
MNVTSEITSKTDSRTAKAVAICETARMLNETSLKLNRGDLKIMNLVILIESAQMFFRNFGFRHATAALGEFAIGLAAGPRRRTEMTATLQRMVCDPRTTSRADGVAGTAARPTD